MKRPAVNPAGISSAAVKTATGRLWPEWCGRLDRAGARSWPHAESVLWLQDQHQLTDWWCQMVTVGYEQASGRRQKHQKPAGLEISVSRTIGAPVAVAFAAWKEAGQRELWLPRTPLIVRKATPHKSIRITWGDGSHVSVNFWPKGPLRCQVVPTHARRPDASTAERMKAYWADRLEALRRLVETYPSHAGGKPSGKICARLSKNHPRPGHPLA